LLVIEKLKLGKKLLLILLLCAGCGVCVFFLTNLLIWLRMNNVVPGAPEGFFW
jgi:hypothetical protein